MLGMVQTIPFSNVKFNRKRIARILNNQSER